MVHDLMPAFMLLFPLKIKREYLQSETVKLLHLKVIKNKNKVIISHPWVSFELTTL